MGVDKSLQNLVSNLQHVKLLTLHNTANTACVKYNLSAIFTENVSPDQLVKMQFTALFGDKYSYVSQTNQLYIATVEMLYASSLLDLPDILHLVCTSD